ncbi:Flp pilus assembly complex ATPase component TadA [Candidatus Woesearchaeota archaeon]|nr:Flp pilus assembly complex ATPase component TadA [Candidatus Woesearchaeota archaeon]
MRYDRIVPDLSILVEGVLSKKLSSKGIEADEIIIHEAILALLEHKANQNKVIGSLGIDEIDRLRGMAEKQGFSLGFRGVKPRYSELSRTEEWETDSKARQLAYDEDAIFITADKTQARIAKAKSTRCVFMDMRTGSRGIRLEKFFDKKTMSVHLREEVMPYAKKGKPGDWKFVQVGKKKLTQEDIQDISREIIEETKKRDDGFIEIERPGSTIVQLEKYRIVITKPPFSDGWEITAVRPVRKLTLKEYELSEKLLNRISEQAEGVLIAGAPGMGKSTFAAALAEYYAEKDNIVKTVEAPRDLVLPEKITQYAISHGDAQEIHDILLLSRPDYTFFDEMRNTADFKLFADLRLAGIGFIGVVHATNPIDAIQRFVGRIELGVIPQVIDTVIFIRDGHIEKVLGLKILVKVPSGMTESDLARPVVTVNDFETGKLEFEMYSYGEETVVVPVTANAKQSPARELAKKQIESEIRLYSDEAFVEMLSESRCRVFVPKEEIPKIIGKQGKQISEIEKSIGIGIDIASLDDYKGRKNPGKTGKAAGRAGREKPGEDGEESTKKRIQYSVKLMSKSIVFIVDPDNINKNVDITVDGDYLMTAKVSKKAMIKVKKNNKIGRFIADAVNTDGTVEILG